MVNMAMEMRTKGFQEQSHVLGREIYDEKYPVRRHNIKNPQTHLHYSIDKAKIQKRSALLVPDFDRQKRHLRMQRFGSGLESSQLVGAGDGSDYNELPADLFDSSR